MQGVQKIIMAQETKNRTGPCLQSSLLFRTTSMINFSGGGKRKKPPIRGRIVKKHPPVSDKSLENYSVWLFCYNMVNQKALI